MTKILFHLNCLVQGGAERVVSNLANHFAGEGYEIIIATEWQGENEFKLEKEVRRLHVGLAQKDEKKSRVSQALLRVKYLRRAIRAENPDVVIAFGHKANYRSLTATVGMKTPVIISVRTDPVGHYDGLADKFLIPLLYPRVAGCVFQTEGQRDFFPKYVRQKSRIILNPLNSKYIGVPKPDRRVKEIVQSGRLVDFKNQPLLISAFIKVHRRYPEYTLKIYGGDSHDGTKELLENLIAANNAGEYIKLMGASDTLEQDLVNASLFAFTSDWEGLPNALMEAMALGLPIVATDCPCGGPRTIMTDGVDGLLIPIKNEEALVEAMCRLIEDPDLAERLGEEARNISEKAGGQIVISQWRDYIHEQIG